MNIKNITERQLNRFLDKTVYVDGNEYKVAFLSTKSKNASEHVRVIYPQEYGWNKGTLFRLKDNYYLIINRDAVESDVYCTSVAMKCNEVWNIKGKNYYLVAGELGSPRPNHGSAISTLKGTVSVYTNEKGMLDIDQIIAAFGGWYKCVNYFYIDGLCYYYFERELEYSQATWQLVREGTTTTTYEVGKTENVGYVLRAKSSTGNLEYYDTNAVYTYSISNPSVARIDGKGNLTPLSSGSATLTVKAESNGKTYTATMSFNVIKVIDLNSPSSASITYSGAATVRIGGSAKKLYAHLFNGKGEEMESEAGTWTWSCNEPGLENYLVDKQGDAINIRTFQVKSGGASMEVAFAHKTINITWTSSDGIQAVCDVEILPS